MQVRGKTAVITGAGSGIGLEIARILAENGCHLALLDINATNLDAARGDMAPHGVRCETYLCDVSDPVAVEACATAIDTDLGGADILVNNAGIVTLGAFADLELAHIQRLFSINLWGVIHCTKAFLPQLSRAGQGHILNTCSLAAIYSQASRSAYSMSKAAVSSLSQCLRKELAHDGIGVSALYPGIIRTNIVASTTVVGSDKGAGGPSSGGVKAHPPRLVAEKALLAIQKNRARAFAGWEVHIVSAVLRLAPVLGDRWLQRLVG